MLRESPLRTRMPVALSAKSRSEGIDGFSPGSLLAEREIHLAAHSLRPQVRPRPRAQTSHCLISLRANRTASVGVISGFTSSPG